MTETYIITTRHIDQLKESLPIFTVQLLLGIHGASLIRLSKSPETPLDHHHAGLVRFALNNAALLRDAKGQNVEDLLRYYLYPQTIEELVQISKECKPIKFFGTELDFDNIKHIAIVLMRTYGTARNIQQDNTALTMSISKWVGVIRYCLENDKTALITQILEDQANSLGHTEALMLKNKGWPKIETVPS